MSTVSYAALGSSAGAMPTLSLAHPHTHQVLDGHILEKPHNTDHAREMLARLSGRDHVVMTGL